MILVTGGAGFIGSNIVAELQGRGETGLVVSDRLHSGEKWRNLQKRELADLVHPENLDGWLADHGHRVGSVIHMGAISSTTETDADLVIENNFRLSLRLWDWCVEREVPFIYASSAATYGDGSAGFDDDQSPQHLAKLKPLNPYGWSKHLFDRRVCRIAEAEEEEEAGGGQVGGRPGDESPTGAEARVKTPPQWVGLKFFNVYGPNEYHKEDMRSVVTKNFPVAARGEAVKLFKSYHPDYPDGGQKRDFVYVKDCVDVVLWFLENPDVSGLFNVGTGSAATWDELIGALFRALGREPRIEYVDMPEHLRRKYQYFTEARMEKLREAGCAVSFRSVEEGVGDFVRSHLDTEDPYV
ncbi:MAG: ADP-glyceromanno-heptose 6-epimerase [Gemmatimonadota bacterium]